MKKKIKVGIFGLGRGCAYAAPMKLLENVEIVAMCDRRESTFEKARLFADKNTKFFTVALRPLAIKPAVRTKYLEFAGSVSFFMALSKVTLRFLIT